MVATAVDAGGRGAGYRSVFAVREFRAVFAAHVLSNLGEVVCGIALAVLVYRVSGSPLLSALTFALGLLPYVLGGALLSAVADRLPARRVLVGCDLVSCGLAVGMVAVAGAGGSAPVGVLLALRAAMAAVSPVFTGTRAATLGEVLGDGDRFVLGRSVIRLTAQSAQLAGFGVGGVLLAAVSPRAVLTATAVGFLASALILRFGTVRRPARAVDSEGGAGGRLFAESLGGAARLLTHRRVRPLLLLAWVPPMFVCVPESLLTAYAGRAGIGSGGLGLLLCGMPIGAVASEALVGSRLGPRGRARLVSPVALLAMLPAIGYALGPGLGWALVCQVFTGCGICYTLGLDQRFFPAVPEELRGRAMTLLSAGLMTCQGLGMAAAGAVADFVPVRAVMAGGGVAGVLSVAAVLWRVRVAERSEKSESSERT